MHWLIDWLILQVGEKKDSGAPKADGMATKTERHEKRADSTDSGLSSACDKVH